MCVPNVGNQQHVGGIAREFEPIRDVVAQNRGRERAEAFAIFHLEVQHLLHGGRTWIAENGAVTESAWTEFHATLHPADGLSFAQ